MRVNLVLYWQKGQKEPWYLATDLDDPQEAIRCYAQRAWIDEMFRDFKHQLGLEESRVVGSARLERLLLGLMLAYLVLAWVGLFAVGPRFVAEVISWGKASLIFLALEYCQTHGPPRGFTVLEGGGMKLGTCQGTDLWAQGPRRLDIFAQMCYSRVTSADCG